MPETCSECERSFYDPAAYDAHVCTATSTALAVSEVTEVHPK